MDGGAILFLVLLFAIPVGGYALVIFRSSNKVWPWILCVTLCGFYALFGYGFGGITARLSLPPLELYQKIFEQLLAGYEKSANFAVAVTSAQEWCANEAPRLMAELQPSPPTLWLYLLLLAGLIALMLLCGRSQRLLLRRTGFFLLSLPLIGVVVTFCYQQAFAHHTAHRLAIALRGGSRQLEELARRADAINRLPQAKIQSEIRDYITGVSHKTIGDSAYSTLFAQTGARAPSNVSKGEKNTMMPLLGTETVGTYAGYPMYEFTLDGRPCKVVVPAKPLPGRQWVWKSEFFEAFPAFELAMLERGYYLVFMDVGNTFGCPAAMRHFDRFYQHLVEIRGFHKRAILLGLSRGGLYCYNWAADNPDKVAVIYADNAVCDFKSWPGGKGVGPGSPDDWTKLQQDYAFASEAEALAYPKNLVDNLAILAQAGIPLIHATATEDSVVPAQENTDILEARYQALGGSIKVFRHSGDHHPHGLEDPTPLIEYLQSVKL